MIRKDMLSSMIGMSPEKLWQQEDLLQIGTNISFLEIVYLQNFWS